MDENAILIQETNALRKELSSEIQKGKQMEGVLGTSTKKTILPLEGQKLLKQAIETKQEIHKQYQDQIEVSLFNSKFNKQITACP